MASTKNETGNNFNLQTIVVDANFSGIVITDNVVVMLVNNRSWARQQSVSSRDVTGRSRTGASLGPSLHTIKAQYFNYKQYQKLILSRWRYR